MTRHPLLWRVILRRLRRALASEQVSDVAGDLLEDYRRDRQARGWLRAEWRVWRDADSVARAYRSVGRARPVDGIGMDMRLAARQMRRQPWLTAAIVLPLMLAVAANTALFSVIDGLLFRPLPFDAPDRLVALSVAERSKVSDRMTTYAALVQNVAESPLFVGPGVASGSSAFASAPDALAEMDLVPADASPGFFGLLGVRLVAGRDFLPSDRDSAPALRVVIGEKVWRRHFAGDPAIVGRITQLAGRTVEIIAIAPAEMMYPNGANVWSPAGELVTTSSIRFWTFARLRTASTIEQVRQRFPDLEVLPLRDRIQPKGTEALVFLIGATGLFLLAAWVQIGALTLSRATTRAIDVGTRLALGAGKGRIFRQYLIEASAVAIAALGLAWLLTPVLTDFVIRQLPRVMTAGQALAPDWRTFAFASALSLVGALLLAIAPVEILRRAAPLDLLRGREQTAGLHAGRIRNVLLVAQIACTTLLLCLAGLALHSFSRVSRVDIGFAPSGLWKFALPALPGNLTDDERQAAYARRAVQIDETMRAIAALDGIGGVADVYTSPLEPGRITAFVTDPGVRDRKGIQARLNRASPDFVRTIGARLRAGELPGTASPPDALVINQALATELSKTGVVVGRRIRIAGVVGVITTVIDDVLDDTPGVPAMPQVIAPLGIAQPTALLIRSSAGADRTRAMLSTTLAQRWGAFSPSRLSLVTDDVSRVTAPWRARSILLGLIAAMCVPLTVAGLTGAMFHIVRTRSREIAIRLALGADAAGVRRSMVGRAIRLAGLGLVIGIAGGVAAGRLMASQLFGVSPADALTIAAVVAGMFLIAWVSAFVPARKAASIPPATTLNDGWR